MNIRNFLLSQLFLLITWSGVAQKAEHLGPEINSEYEEREPIISPDGKTLYFWRREFPGNTNKVIDPGDIWYSTQRADGSFPLARRMGHPLNSVGHDFIWQVAPSGDTLWVSQLGSGDPGSGLGYSVRTRENWWSKIRKASIQGFTYKGKYKDFHLTPQGHMLIPNEGNDTEGGTDIYLCRRINDTTWSAPFNLGPIINTLGDEDAPFLMPDNRTMYFNSNGHSESEQHDVYVTKRLDETWRNWSPPEPIGMPINTPGYDFDLVFSPTMDFIYWGSGFNSFGSNDMFRLQLTGCALDVYPEGDHVLCEGESMELEAGFTVADRLEYQWLKNGAPVRGANGRRYSVTESGLYQVIRYKDQCVDTSLAQQFTFIPSPVVSITSDETFICEQDSLELRSTAPDAASWQWYKNGLKIPAARQPNLWVRRHGTYWIGVSNGTCEAQSDAIRVGRMEKPLIYPADLAETRSRPRPSEWLWTREFSAKNEKMIIKDMAAGPLGRSAVLGLKKNGRSHKEILYVFDREGNIAWQKEGKSASPDEDQYVVMDYESNILVASKHQLIKKYSPNGKLLWKIDRSMYDVSGLATDPLGHVYVMGEFRDTLYLGGQRVRPYKRGSGFLAKFDPWGNFLWVKSFSWERPKYDFGNGVTTDNAGNVFIGGGFKWIAGFGRNQVLRAPIDNRSEYFFLAKYKSDGSIIWTRKHSTQKASFHTGDFFTDPEGNTFMLLNYQLIKYNAKGQVTWRASVKTPGKTVPQKARIAVDGQGTLFTLGITQEKNQYFLSRTDKSGKAILVWQQSSNSKEEGRIPALATNEEGKLYLAAMAGGRAPSLETVGKLPGFVTSFGQPEPENELAPLALCPGESVVLQAKVLTGLPFYWLRNGVPIPGATDSIYTATETGVYQVRAFSGGCEGFSNIQEINDCYQSLAGNVPSDGRPEKPVQPIVQRPEITPEEKPVETSTPIASVSTPKQAPEPTPTPPESKVPNKLQKTRSGIPTRLNNRRVSKQSSVTITNPSAVLYVWDHGAVDNDTISLNVNGKWLLEEFPLKKAKTRLEVSFTPGAKNFIILYAHNLGTVPPNTASLTIDDGKATQTLKLRSNLNSCGSVNVKLE